MRSLAHKWGKTLAQAALLALFVSMSVGSCGQGDPAGSAVSGRVVTGDGTGVPGVVFTLYASGGGCGTPVQVVTARTDGSGFYIVYPGSKKGNVALTPVKPGYSFTPPSRSVTVSSGAAVRDQDFVATAATGTVPVSGGGSSTLAANAGPDQTAIIGSLVTLNGSGSTNLSGGAFTYAWTLAAKPAGSAAVLAGSGLASPTFVPDLEGTYIVSLLINDGVGNSDPDMVTITATASAASSWPKFRMNLQSTGASPIDTSSTTGALKWSYAAGDTFSSSPTIGAYGTLYYGSWDGKLYAVRSDGTFKWSYTTGGGVLSSPALGADGTIYFGSADKRLYAVNPDGTLRWSYLASGRVDSSPAVGPDGTIYFGVFAVDATGLTLSGPDNKFYALNPDGTLKWSYPVGLYVDSSPSIGTDGTIYFGSGNNNIYALNPDGTLRWSFATAGAVNSSSPAIGPDGTIYIGSDKLYAIRSDGTLKWSFATLAPLYSSPALGPDGTIYVGSGLQGFILFSDNKLYAINPDGTLKWSYATGSSVESSPAVGREGTVYFESWDGNLYAVNPDGTLKWKYLTIANGANENISPAIGADGTIYVGAVSVLYAIH